MAISKKYSRRIVVDGAAYRWRVPLKVNPDAPCYGRVTASVWYEANPGHRLQLIGDTHPSESGLPNAPITPQLVADGIRAALLAGWNAESRGPAFLFRLQRPAEI